MNPRLERLLPIPAVHLAHRAETILFQRNTGQERLAKRTDIFYRYPELKRISPDKFPKNVFIIPDGNNTWAQKNGLATSAGHERGADVIVDACRDLADLGEYVPFVGIWGLSYDNLQRPPEEINYLMGLFDRTITKLRPEMKKRGNRFRIIGNRQILEPYEELRRNIEEAEEETKENTGQTIYIALGFNGDDQDRRIDQELIRMTLNGEINDPAEASPELRKRLRDGNGDIPNADLVVRSSGQMRLSGLGWIAEGSELYFSRKLFPDFGTRDFVKAIVEFSKRKRKFGKRDTSQAA